MVNVKIKKKIRRVSAYICLVCLIILAFPFASADLFITQVLYNPLITSTGGEAVEIYNPNDFSVNLAGYTLHTTTRQPDVVFPDNAFIPPRSYFLVADIGWNEKKDSPLYPFADYKQAMTMRMTDGGVAIIDPNQVMVDAVGWGNADGIGLPFYRGVPASYTVRGEALVRINFTNDNSIDFISSLPKFENSKGETTDPRNSAILLNLEIFGVDSYIKNVSIPYDFDDVILLSPGKQKKFNITFFISELLDDFDAYVSIKKNNSEHQFLSSSLSSNMDSYHKYVSSIALDYYLEPGEYEISVVLNSSQIYMRNFSLKILPIMAFQLNIASINCSLAAKNSCVVDSNPNPYAVDQPAIRNIGNQPLDFKIFASDFLDGENSINISNVQFSIGSIDYTKLTNNPVLYHTNIHPGPSAVIPFSLIIEKPEKAVTGSYSTKMFFMGVVNGS